MIEEPIVRFSGGVYRYFEFPISEHIRFQRYPGHPAASSLIENRAHDPAIVDTIDFESHAASAFAVSAA